MKIKYNKKLYPELSIIKEEVEKITGVDDIGTRTRTKKHVFARWLYIKAAKDFTEYSYINIGSAINKDHATITHAIHNMEFDFKYNKDLQTQYDALEIILMNKLYINTIDEIDKHIEVLENTIKKLLRRKFILLKNEPINTEFQNQKNEQVFWS